jgi:hypothetical protein
MAASRRHTGLLHSGTSTLVEGKRSVRILVHSLSAYGNVEKLFNWFDYYDSYCIFSGTISTS